MVNKNKKITQKFLQKGIPLITITIFLASILFSFSSCRAPTAHVSMATDTTKMMEIRGADDQPFFPFGFYCSSFNPNQRMEALRNIAAGGFNTIFIFWDNLDDYGAFLDEAKRLGVHIITELRGDSHLAIVNQFKDKSAVLGWGIADDAGDHQSSDEILAFHRQVKAADSKHYTYVSVSNWSKKWAGYAHVADLIGGQSYPIGYPFNNRPKNLPNDLSEVNYVFNLGRSAAHKHNRPVIANLQTFSWEGQRWPTPHEVYNMTYQALLSGVKGIIFYIYDDGESRIREHPDVWNMLKSLVPEIKKLSPALLEGTFTRLNTQLSDLFAGQWTYGNIIYVVVLNTSRTKTRQVSLPIPAKAPGAAQPLFPGRPLGMVFQDGKLNGLIKPGDVHVYQLSKS